MSTPINASRALAVRSAKKTNKKKTAKTKSKSLVHARSLPKVHASAPRNTKSSELSSYERRVRAELEKKVGKGAFFTDVYNKQYMSLIERSYRSEVHPVAAAGVVLIASGMSPEKAPGGLCCGQE